MTRIKALCLLLMSSLYLTAQDQPKATDAQGPKPIAPELQTASKQDIVLPEPALAPKPQKETLKWVFGDSLFEIGGKLRLEMPFYGVNLKLLNNENNARDPQFDKILFTRYTLDLLANYSYGRASCGYDIVKARVGLRTRSIFGAEESIAPVSKSTIKIADIVTGEHNHNITRSILWARELWLEVVLNDLLGLSSCHKHTVTMGLFPFQLGRGIALGDAYDIDPDFLGFQSVVGIDQYAPGIKLSGDLVDQDILHYDIYLEIATNNAYAFDVVNQRIYSQRCGRLHDPARGFGSFDYIAAARLLFKPINKDGNLLSFEPYALYNNQTEERIEFTADATGKLGTFGLAVEASWAGFEAGFDTAFNVGHQKVYAWDKNIVAIERDGTTGNLIERYTSVREGSPEGPAAAVTKSNKEVVDAYNKCGQQFNGQELAPGTGLFNAKNRFNDQYENKFRGAMFIGDIAYTFIPTRLKWSAMAGIATGGEDPNKQLFTGQKDENQTFKGFVGLQELYSGTRVKSVFLLGGQGRAPRLLSIPSLETPEIFPSQVSRFTNLIVFGTGVQARPPFSCINMDIRPNILTYWTAITETRPTVPGGPRVDINRFLGTELNLITETEILKDLKFFAVGALFVPGGFFKDLSHTPLSKAEREFIASQIPSNNPTPNEGAPVTRVPTLSHDLAYFIQLGFEYKF